MSEDDRKLIVKRPDGTVLEIPLTSKEKERLIASMSGGTSAVVTQLHQKHRGKKSDEEFPTDQELKDFLKDGDKTVQEICERFFGRTINSHAETSLYHRIYNAKARVLKKE